jgi:hypothetical protein
MMLESKIPAKGLDNENYFSFRIERSDRTIVRSGFKSCLFRPKALTIRNLHWLETSDDGVEPDAWSATSQDERLTNN